MNIELKNPNNAARYLLSRKDMSQKKLHKMLYFSYLIYLTENNSDAQNINDVLFENTFQAWVHGPVLREIYPYYAGYSYNELSIANFNGEMTDKAKESLDYILDVYGDYSADQLEVLSHRDEAWRKKRIGLSAHELSKNLLANEDMYSSSLERFYE
ncbi:DUF4065 domain-containing protein [Erysipelothrix rhusiopathiae]|uniref:Panacea domain-containing protein n=1 Tax=Erysipelothrix rhusiopathiae TaxID=1648 RepID=UPI0023B0C492|nr:DUF4065 domain-containing protein [Erysipelothrix rhusiopathiae]MDE8333871.1 DUF4065 domain-containing protein [Erysipelothrix rhusiopathiae]